MTTAEAIPHRRLVSALKDEPQDQQVLWPWVNNRPIKSQASRRHYIGSFYQEATRVLTGAKEHRTDGQSEICPDLSIEPGKYIEVKSIGTEHTYLFKHRLDKDAKLVREAGTEMTYVFWVHDTPCSDVSDTHTLYSLCARHVSKVVVLPFEKLYAATKKMPEKMIQYRQTSDYVPAYSISRAHLDSLSKCRCVVRKRPGKVFGVEMPEIDLRGAVSRIFKPLTERERETASQMLEELSNSFWDVQLVEASNPRYPGHMIRVTCNRSPDWYVKLCGRYLKKRNKPRNFHLRSPDTDIRREFVYRALERLQAGICKYEYDWRLREIL